MEPLCSLWRAGVALSDQVSRTDSISSQDASRRKAIDLFRAGDYARAEKACEKAVRKCRKDAALWDLFGLTALLQGRAVVAIDRFEQALRLEPGSADACNNLSVAHERAGNGKEALRAAERVLKLRPQAVDMRRRVAQLCQAHGQPEKALAHWAAVLETAPRDAGTIDAYAGALLAVADFDVALERLQALFAQPGTDPGLCIEIARALDAERRFGDARAVLEAALKAGAHDFRAHLALADALSKTGDMQGCVAEARRYLEAAADRDEASIVAAEFFEAHNFLDEAEVLLASRAAVSPENPRVLWLQAKLARRRDDRTLAGEFLQKIDPAACPPALAVEVHFELGQLHDGRGECPTAFGHFAAANRLLRDSPAGRQWCGADFSEDLRRQRDLIRLLAARPVEPPASPRKLCFLIGFPRSGTTLLNRILSRHTHVVSLEEQFTVDELAEHVARRGGDFYGALANMGAPEIAAAREHYMQTVGKQVDWGEDQWLVDKMPLNILNVPLISRIFPEARFLFSLRHPYDAVLSCFMQNFQLNAAMAKFLDLDDTVRFYIQVMEFWRGCCDALPLEMRELKYEDLVADFDRSIGAVLAFLELDWQDAVRAFYAGERARGYVGSASYHQVTRPLYASAVGRWRHYREQLFPAVEPLRDYPSHLGYDDS